jgi:hypothetical protein
MSPHPARSRLVQAIRKARSELRGGHVVALSAVAVMAFGLVGLRTVELPGPRPVTEEDRLRIEVVHPVEPEIVPGSVMDVGALVDGFQGVPPPQPSLTDMLWSYDDGWEDRDDGYASPRPADRRIAGAAPYYSPPEPERSSPARALRRWFGFDAPRRDFQAERAARQARLEAMERHARERRDWERGRRERAELDRYAREGWRPVPSDVPRWRDNRRFDERRGDWRDERRPDSDGGPVPYEPHDPGGDPTVELNG